MNNYIVKLNNIKIKAAHGLHDIEKTKKQLFEIDVSVFFSKPTCNDNIEESVDYQHIYCIVENVLKDNSVNLLESLGERIIDAVYKMNNVDNVDVSIRKPEIQFNDNSNCTEVSISRKK